MGSLLIEGNKKAKANQNIKYKGEVKFLFKTFKRAYSKSLALLLEAHTLTLNVRQKITN